MPEEVEGGSGADGEPRGDGGAGEGQDGGRYGMVARRVRIARGGGASGARRPLTEGFRLFLRCCYAT